MDNNSIKKLETDLWEAADLLRQGSKLTSSTWPFVPALCIQQVQKSGSGNSEEQAGTKRACDAC